MNLVVVVITLSNFSLLLLFLQSYVDPCPRNVEKHLKVFRWSLLADMLQNSLAKINFLVQPRLQFILAGSTTGANASFSSSTIAESTSTTAAPTAVVAAVSNIVVNNSEAVLDVAKVNAFEFVSVAKAQGGGGAETSLKPPLAPSATSGSSSNTPMMPLDASQSASSSSSSLVLPAMKSARSSRASASSSHGNIPDNNFNISTAPPGAVDHFKSDDEVEVYIPQPTKSRRRSGNAAAASSGAGNTSISQHPMDISLDEAAAGNNGRRLLMRIPALGSSSSSASSSVIKLNIPVGSRPTTVTAEPAVRPRKKLIESAHQHSIYTLPELPDSAVVNESLQLDNALNAESHIRSAAVAFLANAAAATAATSGGSSTAAVVGAKRRRSSNGPAAVGGSAAKKTYLEDEFDPIYAEPEEDHDDGDEFRVQQATRRRRSGPPSSASSSSLSLPLAAAAGSVSSAPLAGGSNAVMAGKVPVVPNSTSNISSKKDDSDKWMAPTTEPTPGAVTTMLMYGW